MTVLEVNTLLTMNKKDLKEISESFDSSNKSIDEHEEMLKAFQDYRAQTEESEEDKLLVSLLQSKYQEE